MYIYKFVQVKWQRQQQLVESGKATKKVNERLGFEGLIKVLDRLIKIYIYLYSKYYKSQQHINISWTNPEIREAVYIILKSSQIDEFFARITVDFLAYTDVKQSEIKQTLKILIAL